jgi:cell division protease FtsH
MDAWIEISGRALSLFFNVGVPLYFLYTILSVLWNMRNGGGGGGVPGGMGGPGGLPGGMGGAFTQMRTQFVVEKPNVTPDQWAGSPEVWEECLDVIRCMENKEAYQRMGAEMPRGVLLEGPPGTGKTLLAKAVATSTQASFISLSASEFVEMFVGVGAQRVRSLFSTARSNRPCVIFIDEIDAVGKQRGSGMTSNDEREQTLNQLLYEMDGFQDNQDILVMAATNRRDVLDAALLRPGRFARIIAVPLPDAPSRQKILDVYLRDKPVDPAVSSETLAEWTEGFSGAQLKNFVNEAALLAVKRNDTLLQEYALIESLEKLLVGIVKRNATVPAATQRRVAIHESGHALLSMLYSDLFAFQKASIRPTYQGAGGYTLFQERGEAKDSGLYTRRMLKKRLAVTLAGKAAESLYYGDEHVSLGANADLRQANQLARRMVEQFGMARDPRLQVFARDEPGGITGPASNRPLGAYTQTLVDREVFTLVQEAYEEAKHMLQRGYSAMLDITDLLLEKQVVTREDIKDWDVSWVQRGVMVEAADNDDLPIVP